MDSGASDDSHSKTICTETESERFHRFKIVVSHAIEHIASGVSEEEYLQLFGKLSALSKSRTAPIRMQTKMKNNLIEGLNNEVNGMFEEENVADSCRKLDEITDECAVYEGESAWRPNGQVKDHVRSHAMEVKSKHIATLQKEVQEREQTTEQLCHDVRCYRNQVLALSAQLQSIREQNRDCELLDRISAKVLCEEEFS